MLECSFRTLSLVVSQNAFIDDSVPGIHLLRRAEPLYDKDIFRFSDCYIVLLSFKGRYRVFIPESRLIDDFSFFGSLPSGYGIVSKALGQRGINRRRGRISLSP